MGNWRDQIAELIDGECRAWNLGDAVAYSQAAAEDCVFTNIFGQVFVGKQAFEQQHARIFAGIFKGSRLKQSIDHIRLVRPDVAITDTSATLTVPAGDFGPARTLHTKLAQVFAHDGERWRIVSYHNVEQRPPPTH